jgi:hypothetical protein
MHKKGQPALEYLMIIALVLGIIVPTSYFLFRNASESNVEIVYSQIAQIGNSVIDTAEIVYFSGEGSKIVLELKMPVGVANAKILANRELVFDISTDLGTNEQVFYSSVTIPLISDDGSAECVNNGNCDLSYLVGEGLKKITIQAIEYGGSIKVRIMKASS